MRTSLPHPRFLQVWLAWALGAIGLLLFLTDCSKQAMFIEAAKYAVPAALSTGPDLSAQDIYTAFDWPAMDGFERNRFASNLINVALIKTKFLAFETLPYLPSLSLMWLLTHGVGIWFFTRILRFFFPGNRPARWLGGLFFILSPAMMSALLNHFHPAKPMVLTCGIICLYYTLRQLTRSRAGMPFGIRDYRHWSILLLLFALATFSDESGPIIAVLCGAMYPAFFLTKTRGRIILGLWSFCLLAYAYSTLFAAPQLVAAAGYPPFDFHTASARYAHFTTENFFHTYPRYLLWSLYAFIAQHALPFYSAIVYHISLLPDFNKHAATLLKSWPFPIAAIPRAVAWAMFLLPLALLLDWAALRYRNTTRAERETYSRLLLAFFATSAAFVALNQMPFNGNYYYANLTAIPITLLLVKLLDPQAIYAGWQRGLRSVATCAIVVCALFNAYDTNCVWALTSEALSGKDIRAAWHMTPPERAAFCKGANTGKYWMCDTLAKVDSGKVIRRNEVALQSVATGLGLKPRDLRYVFTETALYHPATFLTTRQNIQFPPPCRMCVLVTPEGISAIRFREVALPPKFTLPATLGNVRLLKN